jgi:hypothetical protein
MKTAHIIKPVNSNVHHIEIYKNGVYLETAYCKYKYQAIQHCKEQNYRIIKQFKPTKSTKTNNTMSTINHTNGAAIYAKAKESLKQSVAANYTIPVDQPYLYLDQHNRPFVQQPNSPRMMCTINKTSLFDGGFHRK